MVAKIFLGDHFLCLSLNPTTLSLCSPNKKGLKKRKIKIGMEMYCLQIQGVGHLIFKKYKELK